ncbi:hypothetical protein GTS46_001239 [Salmonella enterica]|nr:hypothetical protein [Salmonella enterica]
MSITVVPFDDALSAQFRDRVTHYLNCRVDQLSQVVPELMRLFRAGLKRVTDGEMALFRGCSLKTLHEYPLLRVLTDGVFADDTGILMQYRSDWLSAASVWLLDILQPYTLGVPSAVTEAVHSAVLAMAFDDFHALVHATAYESAVSMQADDDDDLRSVSLNATFIRGTQG